MSEFVCAKVEIQETAATIGAEREHLSHAVEAIKAARRDIERQIRRDRYFLTALEPYEPQPGSSRVIRRMCEASRAAGVGPMATVAGTIAQEGLEAMLAAGCTHCWVDNGGDIALAIERPATVEVFSEPGSKTAFALELAATDGPVGICTSSGTLGHSISFGNADAVVVIARDAAFADALATAIGNRIETVNDLAHCFDDFKQVKELIGAIAMCNGAVSTYGRIPPIIEAEHSSQRLTVHSKMSSCKYTGSQSQQPEVGT